MRALLASPRRRRRLAWATGPLLAVAALVALALTLEREAKLPPVASPPPGSLPRETAPEPSIRLTPQLRRQLDATVRRFVRTAVVRRNLESAWLLASPSMRRSVTYEEWRSGNLPVLPYPAKALGRSHSRVTYISGRTVGLDVMLMPKPSSGAAVQVYAAEVSAFGPRRRPRLLVDSFYPLTALGAADDPTAPGTQKQPAGAVTIVSRSGKLGTEWLLVPLALPVAIVLIVAGVALRQAYLRRRAERRHREQTRAYARR